MSLEPPGELERAFLAALALPDVNEVRLRWTKADGTCIASIVIGDLRFVAAGPDPATTFLRAYDEAWAYLLTLEKKDAP